ncbi:MAG TPA: chromate transporter, partial [Thermogutta sp.]|nr:chromate transporter [Thermogutta sp.]
MIIKLCQIIWTFAQIGLVSFGGPAASIAIMQRTIVDRRKWVTQSEFLDFVAVSHMIPGPIAVQLSLHLGYRRGGLLGALAAVFGFVVPAAFITWAVAVFYQRSHALPALEACLAGVRPAVLAVILISLWDIAGRLTWNKWRFVLLAAVVGLNLVGIDAIVIMALTLAYSAFYLSVTGRKSRGQGKAVETNSEKGQPPAQGPNLFG